MAPAALQQFLVLLALLVLSPGSASSSQAAQSHSLRAASPAPHANDGFIGGIGVPPPPQPSRSARPPSLLHVSALLTIGLSKTPSILPVDTGAQVTILSLSYVRSLGLESSIDRSFAASARGVGSGTLTGRIHDVSFEIAGSTVVVDVMVLDDEGAEGRIDGLIGLDLLMKLEAKVDVRDGLEVRGRRVPWAGARSEEQAPPSPPSPPPQAPRRRRVLRRRPAFVAPARAPASVPHPMVPPVNSEVEADLDNIDDNTIEDIIAAEDKPDPNLAKKFDDFDDEAFQSSDGDDASLECDEPDSDFDLSGV